MAAIGSASASVGTTKCRGPSIPEMGSQPVRAAIVSSTSELMSGGTDSRTSDAPRTARTAAPLWRLPVKTPLGMPISVATTSAQTASSAVLAARSRTKSMTGRRYWNDWPKSRVKVRSSQPVYRSTSGRSRPRR